jgi:hypothetical protein
MQQRAGVRSDGPCPFLHGRRPQRSTNAPPPGRKREQCRLAREVFGNPWTRVVRPEWLGWQDGTVRKMARSITEGSEEMPILADTGGRRL